MPARKITPDERRARQIKAAMAAKGLTQERLAKQLGIGQSALSVRIAHVDRMSVGDFLRLCKVLEIKPEIILWEEAAT